MFAAGLTFAPPNSVRAGQHPATAAITEVHAKPAGIAIATESRSSGCPGLAVLSRVAVAAGASAHITGLLPMMEDYIRVAVGHRLPGAGAATIGAGVAAGVRWRRVKMVLREPQWARVQR